LNVFCVGVAQFDADVIDVELRHYDSGVVVSQGVPGTDTTTLTGVEIHLQHMTRYVILLLLLIVVNAVVKR